jgi:hypothetical protein
MSEVEFPPNVEQFIGLTNQFLEHFKLSLVLREQFPDTQARLYEVEAQDGPVKVVIHRTSRSFNTPTGEYRIRVMAEAPTELVDFFRGKEMLANRVATLGALITSKEGGWVGCQCLIPDQHHTIAGLVAAAIAHARQSLIVSNWKALSKEESKTVERLSEWSDLDFERLHYEYAHLGIGSIGQRRWILNLLDANQREGAILTMDAVHNNPYWGGGLLCLLRMKGRPFGSNGNEIRVNELNVWANLVANTPAFGAWCAEGNDFVYVQFVPNFMKQLPGLMDLLVAWARSRSREFAMFVELECQSRPIEEREA